jgi:hypothetical protein
MHEQPRAEKSFASDLDELACSIMSANSLTDLSVRYFMLFQANVFKKTSILSIASQFPSVMHIRTLVSQITLNILSLTDKVVRS